MTEAIAKTSNKRLVPGAKELENCKPIGYILSIFLQIASFFEAS